MARETFQTLSEPMYYILLALITEQCGVDIMSRVEKISRGRITVGPGTVYALLDKFLTSGLIRETRVDGRRRSYVITDLGKEFLRKEQDRLHQMLHDGETRSEGELK
jgi:DNA-binding PadR family transcriptional regulator